MERCEIEIAKISKKISKITQIKYVWEWMVIFKIKIKRHQCRLITPPNRFSYCILGIQSHASIENEWKLLKIGFENAWNPTPKLIKYGINWWFSTGSRVHKLHTHIHIRNQSWILKYFNIVSIWLLNHRWITSYLLSAILKSTLSVLLSLISSAEQQAHTVCPQRYPHIDNLSHLNR